MKRSAVYLAALAIIGAVWFGYTANAQAGSVKFSPMGSVRFSSSQTECDTPPANADFLHMSAAALQRFGVAPRPVTGDLGDWLATAQASKTRACPANRTLSGVQLGQRFAPMRVHYLPNGSNEAAYQFTGVTSYQNHAEYTLNCGVAAAYSVAEAYHYTGLDDASGGEILTAGVDTVYSGGGWRYYLAIQDYPDDATPFHVKSVSCGDHIGLEVWSWGGGAYGYMKVLDYTTGYYATYHNAAYIPANPTAWFGEETYWSTASTPVANDGYGFSWYNDYGYIWNGTKWGWGTSNSVHVATDGVQDLAQCNFLSGSTAGGPFTFTNWFVNAE